MSLSAEQLDRAAALLAAEPDLRAAAARVRALLAPLRATVADAADLRGETPVRRSAGRSLYLMHTDGHCWSVTTDPAHAGAVLLAQD
ncbi:MAG: hypothetical protein HZB72_12435 [Burkholderiales bacterium]|nr:hypothetical protein [Burkholderiales bacterium]